MPNPPRESEDPDAYQPSPDELEGHAAQDAQDTVNMEDSPDDPGGPDAEADDFDPEEARAHEQDFMLKSGIALFLVVVAFTFGVWSLQWSLLNKKATRPEVAHKITIPVTGLHRAMHGQGIILHQSGNPAELDDWVKATLGPHASVPDLSAAGLSPVGARALKTGKGFGFIRYQGSGGDLLVLFSPRDMMVVPAEVESLRMGGAEMWLETTPTLRLLYLPGASADWALVAAPGQADLPAVARVMLTAPGANGSRLTAPGQRLPANGSRPTAPG